MSETIGRERDELVEQLRLEQKKKEGYMKEVEMLRGKLQVCEEQNQKLRKDFKRSIGMLEKMKGKFGARRLSWVISDVGSFLFVGKEERPIQQESNKGNGFSFKENEINVNNARAKMENGSPQRQSQQTKLVQRNSSKKLRRSLLGNEKTKRRALLPNRRNSVEKYQSQVLGTSREAISIEKSPETRKSSRWDQIKDDLDECRDLIKNESSSKWKKIDNDTNANKPVVNQNKESKQKENVFELNVLNIGDSNQFEYNYKKCKAKEINKGKTPAFVDFGDMVLSENDVVDILSNSKLEKKKKSKISYDDGLFEYLQQTGEIIFE